ncbi:MAG: thermonuclease family protein [Planctomycetes bacterium]|nr:thermonuclease family protein [Planctomycetota bacterium]
MFNPFRLLRNAVLFRRRTGDVKRRRGCASVVVSLIALTVVGSSVQHFRPAWITSVGNAIRNYTGIEIPYITDPAPATGSPEIRHPAGFSGGTGVDTGPSLFTLFAALNLTRDQVERLPDSPPPPTAKPAEAPWRTIGQVVSGDIVVIDGHRVKLLGVDAPELERTDEFLRESARLGSGREQALAAYGAAALALTRQAAEGKRCWVEYDGSNRDPQGRVWAYIHLEDGINLNEALIYSGYARVDLERNFRYLKRYVYLQAEAERLGHGLWSGR